MSRMCWFLPLLLLVLRQMCIKYLFKGLEWSQFITETGLGAGKWDVTLIRKTIHQPQSRKDPPGGEQRGGNEDSLRGSFRDPHFQLVAVHDVTLRDKTTQLVTLSPRQHSPTPLLSNRAGVSGGERKLQRGDYPRAAGPAGIKDREEFLLEVAQAEPRQQLVVTQTQPSNALLSHAWALAFMPIKGHRIFHRL